MKSEASEARRRLIKRIIKRSSARAIIAGCIVLRESCKTNIHSRDPRLSALVVAIRDK
jgi:hypothetical protein